MFNLKKKKQEEKEMKTNAKSSLNGAENAEKMTEKEKELNRKYEKPKDFKGTFRKLIKYMNDSKLSLLLMLVFSIMSVIFMIIGPKILGRAVTKIFEGIVAKLSGNPNAFDFTGIRNILIILLILYVLSAVFTYIQGILVAKVAQRVSYRMRRQMSEKINKLPLKYFDSKTHGEILSRVVNDVDTISMTLNQAVSQMVSAVVTIIGVLVMMLSISIRMTLAALIILPISAITVGLLVSKSQKFFKANSKTVGQVNSHVEEAFSGYTIIKAFNGENQSIDKFKEINGRLYDSAWKSQFASSIMMPMMGFIGNLGYVFVAILGGYLAIRKLIEVGDIVSFTQYIRQFTQPMAQVAQISSVLQSTLASAERVFEVLEEKEEDTDGTRVLNEAEVKGEIEFRNVRFGYDSKKAVIKNFSCKVEPGMNVAIVGPTGAGKTTLIKLLMRFYEPDSGEILLDGVNIKEYTRDSLRSAFGMVLQDTWLFNGSIGENIKYGNINATDEEMIDASNTAHSHHFILTQPKDYDMKINEEANNISQGQKQLLTIARAVISNPKIMILDEATSSVDTRTEKLIQKGMENLSKGRTSFIIAHRLSTIVDADLILVMKDGDIVEMGNHEQLMKEDGFYKDLYQSQFDAA